MAALAVDTIQGLSKCIHCNPSRATPWYRKHYCVNGATGLFRMLLVSYQNEMRHIVQYNWASHTSQRVPRPSQIPRLGFT